MIIKRYYINNIIIFLYLVFINKISIKEINLNIN